MGKTSIALQLAIHKSIDEGKVVGYHTLELSAEQLTNRLLGFSPVKTSPNFTTEKIMSASIYLLDATQNSMQLASAAKDLKQSSGIDVLIIDYFQIIPRFLNVDSAKILANIKSLALELNISILILSQLSRMVEKRKGDHRPEISDLYMIENLDYVNEVFFLYRRNYYERASQDNFTEIIYKQKP